jgi:predicted alpha/beta hydrolase family esterase
MRLSTSKLRSTGHQVLYPQVPDPDTPHPDKWQELLSQEANMLDEIQGGEKILVAHSLGTINFIYGCLDEIFNNPFDRVLLVAPPDPIQTGDTEGIQGEPLDLSNPLIAPMVQKFAKSLTVIASDNDRWLPRGVGIYKAPLGVEPVIYPGAGHFSLDDGWGEWPGLIRWIETGNDQDLIS